MRVPKYIRDKMHRIAKLSQEMIQLSHEVDNWFIEKGYDIEKLRSGDGMSLEGLEMASDITDKFCKAIEEDEYGKVEYFDYEKYENT